MRLLPLNTSDRKAESGFAKHCASWPVLLLVVEGIVRKVKVLQDAKRHDIGKPAKVLGSVPR
eukprot:CAMPEP_0178458804 /NCGR_PEP_ID=MMETSP0689_2-20121128/47743_1 /TAXON_ID=160604 /ORGANISM="Amphidinium massartii, Strain CS-259" /LENGTH=61 /DNA_ID=CAMNT_0020085141 /DNA_START=474 /DNA_END=659 /DNA_ORIENTATION=+